MILPWGTPYLIQFQANDEHLSQLNFHLGADLTRHQADLLKREEDNSLLFDLKNYQDILLYGIEGSITYKDILGNKTELDIKDLNLMAFHEVKDTLHKEITEESEEENESDDWLSKF